MSAKWTKSIPHLLLLLTAGWMKMVKKQRPFSACMGRSVEVQCSQAVQLDVLHPTMVCCTNPGGNPALQPGLGISYFWEDALKGATASFLQPTWKCSLVIRTIRIYNLSHLAMDPEINTPPRAYPQDEEGFPISPWYFSSKPKVCTSFFLPQLALKLPVEAIIYNDRIFLWVAVL